MNYEEFMDYIENHLLDALDDNTYDISIQKITKNNGIILDGLTIRKKGESLSPNIYLNAYYDSYQLGKPISVIIDEIVLLYQKQNKEMKLEVLDITDYSSIKDSIVLRLVNFEKNKEMLHTCPHRKIMDLAVTFRYMVSKDAMGIASSLVSSEQFDLWNVDFEEVYKVALINTMREFPCKIDSLFHMLKENLCAQVGDAISIDLLQEFEQMENGIEMYVLTNEYGVNGATCILYDYVIRDFAKEHACNLYILPSSVHEVMLVPECAEISPAFLTELVRDANCSAVGRIDLLSDHIYYFDREDNQIIMYEEDELVMEC